MTTRQAEEWPATRWPAKPWELTAPESYVLLHGRKASGLEALKLALVELVARRALLLEPVEVMELRGRMRRNALREGPMLRSISEPSLLPPADLFGPLRKGRLRTVRGSAGQVEGVLLKDFAPAAARAFSDGLRLNPFGRYLDRHVIPSLVRRGLVGIENRRLGVFSRGGKFRTPAGIWARSDLQAWMRVGEERLSRWLSDDPSRALAYVTTAGAAVLLVTNRYPELSVLGRRLRERGGLEYAGVLTDADEGPGGDSTAAGLDAVQQSGDLGALDLSTLGLDFSALDGIDGAFRALDAGMAAGLEAPSGGGG